MIQAFFTRPWIDLKEGMDSLLDEGGAVSLGKILIGLVLGWWFYVPVHELLHVAGCLVSGGTVTELELSPLYGGTVLESVFPFVVAGGDYAGRLSGFSTPHRFSYLMTDLLPFVLAIVPGVWLLRWAAQTAKSVLWGFSLPMTFSPFLSLSGDAIEIATLLLTSIEPFRSRQAELVSDDLFRLLPQVSDGLMGIGVGLAIGVAILWAWSIYGISSYVAVRLGRPSAKLDA